MKRHIWPAAAAFLLLVSCSQGTEGIFASIEREQKIKSAGGLSKVATITNLAELSSNYYIAGGGYLFHRAVGGVKWQASSIDVGGKSYVHVMSVGADGTKLYAVANLDSTDSNQLFSSPDGSTWALVSVPAGYTAFSLVPVHNKADGYSVDKLVLTTVDTAGSFRFVHTIASGTVSGQINLGIDYSVPVTGAAYDGSKYYFVNNDAVLYGNTATAPTPVTGSGDVLTTSNGFYDVLLLPSGPGSFAGAVTAVVSGSKGVYWGTLAAGAWAPVGENTNVKDNLHGDVTFGPMIYQDMGGSASTTYVWIGTLNASNSTGTYQGAGIASLSSGLGFDLQPPGGTDSDNFRSSVLIGSQIWSLNRTVDGTYYAGTAAQGMWNWKLSSLIWSQE